MTTDKKQSEPTEQERKSLDFHLWPKQEYTLYSPAQEKLYGGSAGPGKSYLARVTAITLCMAVPGLQVFLFRRTRPDLYLSHYVGKHNFHEMLADMKNDKAVTFANLEIKFSNGSKIHGCHCEHEKDVYNYKSAEMHVRIFEEATEFTPFQIQYMATRARFPEDLRHLIPEWLRPMLPLALYPTNFDDQGGSKEYLCELFGVYEHWESENRYEPGPIVRKGVTDRSKGKTYQYIPALLDDNPSIDKAEYIASIEMLRHPDMVRALIEGDPTIQMGMLWPELSRERHVLEKHVDPPDYLTAMYAHDWGSSAPAATVWGCVCDGEFLGLPRGAIYIFKEWYTADPQNKTKGMGYSNKQLAEGIYEREPKHHQQYLTDSLPFQERGGIPMYEEYSSCGVHLTKADMSSKEVSVQAVRSLLIGRDGYPLLYFSPDVHDTFRTMSIQIPHPNKPEKPADHPEDHLPDCVMHIARAWKTIQDKVDPQSHRVKAQAKKEWERNDRLIDLLDADIMPLG